MSTPGQGRGTGFDAFLLRDVGVEGRDIKSPNDGCTGDLVLDTFKFAKEVRGVMDVRGDARNQRLEKTINEHVGEPFPDTKGLPGLPSLCILGRI